MTKILNYFNNILSIGTKHLSHQEDVNTIRTLNFISFVGAYICLLLIPLGYYIFGQSYFITNFLLFSACMVIPVLNWYRQYKIATFIFIIVLPSLLLYYSYQFGNIGADNYIIVIGILTAYFLNKRAKNKGVFFIILLVFYIGAHIVVDIHSEGFQAIFTKSNLIYYPTIILSLIMIYISVDMYKNKINKQKEAIKQSDNLKSKIISLLSHDFRSPINSLKSFTMMYKQGLLSKEEVDLMMDKIYHQLEKTSLTMENTLIWAKQISNGISISPQKVEVNNIVQQVIDLFQHDIEEKKITVTNNLSKSAVVYIDKMVLEVIIRNIFHNAIKYTDENNGTIDIDTSIKNKHIGIHFTDNGSGISDSKKNEIIKFSTLSNYYEHKNSGHGIGLFLVTNFIKESKGFIEIDSPIKNNKGTKFSIFLPNN